LTSEVTDKLIEANDNKHVIFIMNRRSSTLKNNFYFRGASE